jgi:hypothetical protein
MHHNVWLIFACIAAGIATLAHGYPWGQARTPPYIHFGWLSVFLVLLSMLVGGG